MATSLLFQSGKASVSSSSSSSSSANPFQALAHFYEQELSDLHVDSRLQQQPHSGPKSKPISRLFPSYAPHASDARPSASSQDEFRSFSQRPSAIPNWNSPAQSHLHITSPEQGQGQAHIDEYLRQRQDYYAREALIRSQDRHDGLGPIVDFSYPHSHNHSGRHHHHPHNESRPESKGSRGSSQLEQVWMDLGPDSVPAQLDHYNSSETLSREMESAWSKYNEGTTQLRASALTPGQLGVSDFRQAAASLHSPWPMAPWAIEAEAAFMEVETIHHQHIRTANYSSIIHPILSSYQQKTTVEPQHPSWEQEFSCADSNASTGSSNRITGKEQELAKQDIRSTRRGSTVITCGYILEAKNHRDTTDITFLDPEVTSFKAADVPSQPNTPPTQPTAFSDTLALEQQPTSHPPVNYDSIHKHPAPLSQLGVTGTKPKEQPGQVFNDDLFEGDMLQAWMDTLAQERQEADEQHRKRVRVAGEVAEEKSDKQETTDQVVLEVALRRLNVLMHQLGRTQTSSTPSFTSTNTSNNNRSKPAATIREDAYFS